MDIKPIRIEEYGRLKKYFSGRRFRLSAYSLASIVAWSNSISETYYTEESNRLIISCRFRKRPQDNYLLLPIGSGRAETPHELAELAGRAGCRTYSFVPEDYINLYGRERISDFFSVELQPHFSEYLYETSALAALKGNRFREKRNWINRFSRDYIGRGRVAVEDVSPGSAGECIDFLEEWCSRFPCTPEENESLYCEKQAALVSLKNLDELELRAIQIRIDGRIRAFGVASYLSDEVGVLSFEKALVEIKGLYQFLDRECARRLFPDHPLINKESDMGLPGLAKSKKSYHPVGMVNSYSLTLK
ncbi:MAG TPA: phosphatidylglycerol lysyltransferase domain-containing protein [Syntrophales bacterium]|nr:phosphatidylglycerol lysyltransferase domain-containing protein [Syntrophales bacterium]